MKRILTFLACFSLTGGILWAIPLQITFQGTLKQSGAPLTGSTSLQFSFVDGTGATIPGTVPVSMTSVQVTNGLFAVQLPLDPTINWQAYTPYIQVSIQGQVLSPNQPLTSNLYSMVAQTVVDGAITTVKIATGAVTTVQIASGAVTTAQLANSAVTTVQIATGAVTTAQLDPSVSNYLVPSGAIMLFTSNCPSNWTRFSGLDNNFPMGGPSYGVLGGSPSHTHTLVEGPQQSAGSPNVVGAGSHGGSLGTYPGGSANFTLYPVTDTTTSASNIPPYLTMVYCQKN